ncbi:hypothetical protein CEP51_008948 [Fusarium floridanum]|uniref:Ribonuclease H1 N-terminal domain-containing protein n=1 Tax=Fusarium floridanum TaxID=1325733 RepID=A0A428RJ44_9HYPO|nr:hypothetical protein CEP51_008948 [Fusarium floridanum]
MARRPYTHYGVRVGRRVGVFTDWSDCAAQVSGYSGQCYHGFYSYQKAFDFAYGERRAEGEGAEQPEPPPQLAVGHTPEAAFELEDVFDNELETPTIPEPATSTAPESEVGTTPEPATSTAPEPATVAEPEPEAGTTPEPTTATESETETVTQPTTTPDAEPGHQEQPPAKKARHTQGQVTETFSDTQENTFSSDDIVDEAGESSSSATDLSETVYNDIRQAQERLSALMEGGGAVKIIPVPPKRKREE